jgi:soluble lytic murein transglycosylase
LRDSLRYLALIAEGILLLVFAGILMNRISKSLEHQAYPTDYSEYIEPAAEENGLPLSVVYAVVRQESNFDPMAESKVGARGLMQITKETYEWVDYAGGGEDASWADMYDPETNVNYCTWLLSYLYEEFGNWECALAAYHAGRTDVNNWLQNPDYSSDGKTLEVIPYEETADYVKKVLNYRQNYRRVYNMD